ncbi:SDR family oxidoreductase [Diaphorobacter sp. HDW4B]|uniref:SDR family oxidoreductase n=1 Tax=Diaphorobacter sp. HDW4B TaxID=2714925 RepID=UPI0014083C25|nr:SDR family NAD(P)-dependent oxidoreductase [Diaphorobacter sp. HDW4B]QIL69126.1 SDR family oxidoreductase [Diaphorobacter sp. HDW4B]
MKTAIVTGAGKGIGFAVAERLTAERLRVIRIDISGDVDAYVDVSSSAAVDAFFDRIGSVDVLVNSAGIAGPSTPVAETDSEAWQRTIDINLSGTFYMCRGAVRSMARNGWGRIVNLASIAGKEGNQNQGAYSASKGGVIALTKSLGKELARSGVLVNAIAPGLIETDIISDMSDENKARSLSKIPMGRMGTAQEVAALVAWLSSNELAFSTGAVYDISGGRATY